MVGRRCVEEEERIGVSREAYGYDGEETSTRSETGSGTEAALPALRL